MFLNTSIIFSVYPSLFLVTFILLLAYCQIGRFYYIYINCFSLLHTARLDGSITFVTLMQFSFCNLYRLYGWFYCFLLMHYVYIYIYIHTHAHIYMCVCVCVCVCARICTYIHIHIYVYMHICIHIENHFPLIYVVMHGIFIQHHLNPVKHGYEYGTRAAAIRSRQKTYVFCLPLKYWHLILFQHTNKLGFTR